MTPHHHTLAAVAAVGLLLTGCTSDPTPAASGTPSASAPVSASTSPTASASPSSTLSVARQKAVDQATEAIRAYEQTIYDLLADPEPYLADMNNVAAQPQLDLDLRSLQQIVVAGETVVETTGPVVVTSAKPIKFDLKGDPPTVLLVAWVDRSANSGTESGKPWTGLRQESQYRVVKTTYLPDPGWAVAKVLPPKGFDQPQPC